MNVLLFGATGMVGDGVLHECLGDPRVTSVLSIGRSPLGFSHPKLRELRRSDLSTYGDLANDLRTIDACFFCLGVSALGMKEADYYSITFDLTLAAARALAAAHPGATFCYVSGQGTDSTERGRVMWARVKGKTENALLALPLDAYMFRPGFIRARPGGVRSKTRLYRVLYIFFGGLYPLLRRFAPSHVTTVENMGRAMLAVTSSGYEKHILETVDINRVADRARQSS
jgi:uncharacterized protein YbjT (DUF2867 family)